MTAAVSIVIPVYNALNYARECLDSVYRAATLLSFEVIVVNNGSTPEVAAWLATEQLRRRDLHVLHFDEPLGFARAVNEGAKQARFASLVLLNSDCAIQAGCLDAMARAMEADPRMGIVSPVTNHSGPGPQLVSAPPAAGVTRGPIYEPQRLFFYCAMIRRTLWDALAGLDEVYGVGTFEDDDFCLRARMAGWSLAVLPDVFVTNRHSETFRENRIDRYALMARNREIFYDRASQISRTPHPPPAGRRALPAISVIVPVSGGDPQSLVDSLTSLANQTVTAFETIIVARNEVTLPDLPGRRKLVVPAASQENALIDAGIAAAQGEYLAYLPAGDHYYPYHMEVLYDALSDGAGGTASTQCRNGPGGLLCWMHRRSHEKKDPLVLPRITCQRGVPQTEIHAVRQRTGDRARQLLVRNLPKRAASPEAPQATVLPAVFLFNIVRWDALTQRPHHFATGLAKRGYRVFWIDVQLLPPGKFLQTGEPRKLFDNLFHVQLPGLDGDIYHLPWTGAVLELMIGALENLRAGPAVQLVNFPGWTPLATQLRQRFGWPILYDCLDDQQAFGELYGQQSTAAYEEELTGTCDLLVTSGLTLHEQKGARHTNAILLPNAADYEIFSAAVSGGLLDQLPAPRIGFFGAFADWLDMDWIGEAARRFPACSFVYIGSEGFARPENRARWLDATSAANVHVLPRVNLTQLAAYSAQFDVCIMPFQDLPITRSMHAVKLYEYLAAGKHVLAPALPETRRFAGEGLLFTYESFEQSFELLAALARNAPTENQIAARRAFAANNTWSHRLDRLTVALNGLLPLSGGPKSVA